MNPHRIRIRIEIFSWIRIRIFSMRIRNTGYTCRKVIRYFHTDHTCSHLFCYYFRRQSEQFNFKKSVTVADCHYALVRWLTSQPAATMADFSWTFNLCSLFSNLCFSTEMLNSATELLRMKSTVTKLMNKCQKITEKMEGTNRTIKSHIEGGIYLYCYYKYYYLKYERYK